MSGERPPGGPEFGGLLESARRLLDAVAAAEAPDEVVLAATRQIEAACAALEPYGVEEEQAPAGNRPDLPGRGSPLLVPLVLDHERPDEVRGRVTFHRAHLGGGKAAHGGVQPLLFDELLGRLASIGRPRSRTAYLRVDYRKVTPLGVELRVEGRIRRTEGRKIFAYGQLLHGEQILAEAEALFVQLRP
ncbi:PaaI family thioesterase [Streptomyces sp. GQFP]|uniref:PaaI family thioesterase n=1 Tax=Streptomyces sp. GQFP TaxID=2907545 RepID=UPI001F21588F|nr:PaaI family thioesterase [Streptomyces sp. GQFP]UIX29375.1 PaaI family thioesterase [Streptomyces sp. GQFP]